MSKLMSLFFFAVGILLLALGYSADARLESYQKNIELPARFQDRKINGNRGMAESQIKPFDDLSDSIEAKAAHIGGQVQYCAGWILLGIGALILFQHQQKPN